MKSMRTISSVVVAFGLGVVTTSLLPGCDRSRPIQDLACPTAAVPEPAALAESAVAVESAAVAEPPAVADTQEQVTLVEGGGKAPIVPGDWCQWAGTSYRNNTPIATNIPVTWEVGDFDRKTGAWISDDASQIKWVAPVGSQTYGNPVIAGSRLFVGTNNSNGYLQRYPADVDLGCLLAFDEQTGAFLWQDSSEKLPTGRVHDWPLQGICCAPLVEGKRLWYVTSRGEVVCLDTEGFYDGEDDGPIQQQVGRLFDIRKSEDIQTDKVAPATKALDEGLVNDLLRQRFVAAGMELPEPVTVTTVDAGKKWRIDARVDGIDRAVQVRLQGPNLSAFKVITADDKQEADRIWVFDMMAKLRVSQHNMCSCSVTAVDDILFVNTSNGVDEAHISCPSPDAPSFIAMNKNTGEVYWTDNSPGENILHGQWSSPAAGLLGGVQQVIFGGGDGWVYSFRADKGHDGKPELLWKFDANPKESKWILGGSGTRNNIIATPVIHNGLVYVAVGQDPEHGEGVGHLWCIDPTKRGDVSPKLAVRADDTTKIVPPRREQAVQPELGEIAIANPNSAAVWEYSQFDQNGDDEIDFEEEMHRSCGTVAIKDRLLYISDFSGLFHCLDAETGKPHWTYDMLAAAWGSPLIVDDHVYIGDEDGDVCVFNLTADAA